MPADQRPLVSVVTPVYDGEPYLRECIESILAQTYSHWEYTIVNNCSTDRTLQIALEYASKDPRIRIHNNSTFVRVIENHNIAFRQISAESKYCKVVAADDWIFPDCLEKMVDVAEQRDTVAIVGAYGLMGTQVKWTGLPYPSTVVSGRDVCRLNLVEGTYVFGTATSLLFRSSIVRSREAFYNESNLHGDSEACFDVLERQDFGFVHQVLTFSRMQQTSLTSLSQRLNTYLPYELYKLQKYGPNFLTQEELADRLKQVNLEYGQYLGREFFNRREQEFWRYHRSKLSELGRPLTSVVLPAAVGVAADLVLNPKATVEGILRRIRRRNVGRGHSGKAIDPPVAKRAQDSSSSG